MLSVENNDIFVYSVTGKTYLHTLFLNATDVHRNPKTQEGNILTGWFSNYETGALGNFFRAP